MTSPAPEVIDLASHRAYPISKQHGRVINPYNEGKQEAFVAGAEWLKKWQEEHIWHPDSVAPTKGKYIIVKPMKAIMLPTPHVVFTTDQQTVEMFLNLKKPCIWAYLDDILPEGMSEG